MVKEDVPAIETADRIDLTGMIAIAYVSNNILPAADIPRLLADVHSALLECDRSASHEAASDAIEKPSVAQIKKSIAPEGMVSFIDGKTYTMLKRHLTKHGLDPNSYRQRFGLPAEYPMTAPNYSARRSTFARERGLGRRVHQDGPEANTAD